MIMEKNTGFYLKRDVVRTVNMPAEEAIRSAIRCGAGSGKLIHVYLEKGSQPQK